MKKISEMNQEELQDYALQLEGEKQNLQDQLQQSQNDVAELTNLNKGLLKRNQKLFSQLEQQNADIDNGKEEQKQNIETCDEFAKRLALGGKN